MLSDVDTRKAAKINTVLDEHDFSHSILKSLWVGLECWVRYVLVELCLEVFMSIIKYIYFVYMYTLQACNAIASVWAKSSD